MKKPMKRITEFRRIWTQDTVKAYLIDGTIKPAANAMYWAIEYGSDFALVAGTDSVNLYYRGRIILDDYVVLEHGKLRVIDCNMFECEYAPVWHADKTYSGNLCNHLTLGARSIIKPGTKVGNDLHITHSGIVHSNCRIGDCAYIGPNTQIKSHVHIGNDCIIAKGCTIEDCCIIGERAKIHSSVKVKGCITLGEGYDFT